MKWFAATVGVALGSFVFQPVEPLSPPLAPSWGAIPGDGGDEGEDDDAPAGSLMEQKLELAKGLLTKLAKDDFAGAASDAAAMAALTRDRRWKVRDTPEYLSRSVEFERAATALAGAAGERNADGAALAWVQVNLQCLECHRHVRTGKREK